MVVIPGAVDSTSARALVLARRGTPVRARLRLAGAGPWTDLPVQRPVRDAKVEAKLIDRKVDVHLVRASGLTHESSYELSAIQGGEFRSVQFRTLPRALPQQGLTVAIATCYYDYFKVDTHYLAALQNSRCWLGPPAFKILAGDNLYVDVAPGQFRQWGAFDETVGRYIRYFYESGYARVLSHLPSLTTWDDHEFWNNYPEVQAHLGRSQWPNRASYKQAAQACLDLFQRPLNPSPACVYRVDLPPLAFIVVDLRSRRTKSASRPREMLPGGELRKLEQWLGQLAGPAVLVLGQPLWIRPGDKNDWNPPKFEEQDARIWKALSRAPHDVLVVSGDVHHSRVLEVGLPGGRSVPEFVTSPACHVPKVSSVIVSGFLGSWGEKLASQDRSEVNAPDAVALAPGTGFHPTLGRYLFGTNAQNTFGLLSFRPVGAGAVEVGGAFIDSKTGRPAKATPGKFGGRRVEPARGSCLQQRLFVLR